MFFNCLDQDSEKVVVPFWAIRVRKEYHKHYSIGITKMSKFSLTLWQLTLRVEKKYNRQWKSSHDTWKSWKYCTKYHKNFRDRIGHSTDMISMKTLKIFVLRGEDQGQHPTECLPASWLQPKRSLLSQLFLQYKADNFTWSTLPSPDTFLRLASLSQHLLHIASYLANIAISTENSLFDNHLP